MKYNNLDIYDKKQINWFGRNFINTISNNRMVMFGYSATGFEINVRANNVFATFYSESLENERTYIKVFVDGKEYSKLPLSGTSSTESVCLYVANDNEEHTIRVVKCNGVTKSKIGLVDITGEDLVVLEPKTYRLNLEFFGDSITCGYGVDGDFFTKPTMENEDATKSYAYVCSEILKAKSSMVCVSGISVCLDTHSKGYKFIDIYDKVCGENSKKYNFDQLKNCIIINLGTNDISMLISKKTKEYHMKKLKEAYINLIEALYEVEPNVPMILCYNAMRESEDLETVIMEVKKYFDVAKIVPLHTLKLIPNSKGSRKHPNVAGQKMNGEILADYILKILDM